MKSTLLKESNELKTKAELEKLHKIDSENQSLHKLLKEFRDSSELLKKENSELNQKYEVEREKFDDVNLENQILRQLLSEKSAALKQKDEKKETIRKSVEDEAEISRLKLELKRYQDLYNRPISGTKVLDPNETKIFHEYVDFLNAYAGMPNSTTSKMKLLKKEVCRIENYESNSHSLLTKCK